MTTRVDAPPGSGSGHCIAWNYTGGDGCGDGVRADAEGGGHGGGLGALHNGNGDSSPNNSFSNPPPGQSLYLDDTTLTETT